MAVRLAVGLRAAGKTMALHDASKPAPLGYAYDVHQFALLEDIRLDDIAEFEFGRLLVRNSRR